MTPEPQVLFREVQRFRQPWLWATLIGTAVVALGPMAWGAWSQLVLGQPWGNQPLSDLGLELTLGMMVVGLGGVIALFAWASLTVEVTRDELRFRFWPFQRAPRSIRLADITSHEACRYSPIRDYGGWGVRGLGRDKAYNVSGDRGVRLTLADGRKLLFGSQRPDELDAAIARA